MKNNLVDEVNLLRKQGDYQYVISKYVKSYNWLEKFNNIIKEKYCYDMTDFNYSTCFTIWINITDTDAEVGGEKFRDFLQNNEELLILSVEISVISPYYIIKYLRYSAQSKLECRFSPFKEEETELEKKIILLLENEELSRLYESDLNIIIPDIKLELKEDNVTVYNCLFEDSY